MKPTPKLLKQTNERKGRRSAAGARHPTCPDVETSRLRPARPIVTARHGTARHVTSRNESAPSHRHHRRAIITAVTLPRAWPLTLRETAAKREHRGRAAELIPEHVTMLPRVRRSNDPSLTAPAQHNIRLYMDTISVVTAALRSAD